MAEEQQPEGRFKETMRVENPISAPGAIMSGFRWNVKKAGEEVLSNEGSPLLAFSAVPGEYTLQAEAQDGEGKTYRGETTLNVPVKEPASAPPITPGTEQPGTPGPGPSTPAPVDITPSPSSSTPGELRLTLSRVKLELAPDGRQVEATYRVQGEIDDRKVELKDVQWTITETKSSEPAKVLSGESVTVKLSPGVYRLDASASAEGKSAKNGGTDAIAFKPDANFQPDGSKNPR